MKIVLDTNVVISGTINPYGAPGIILQRVITGDLGLCYDARILAEYEEVLSRKEFGFSRDQIAIFLGVVETTGHLISPAPLTKNLPDVTDHAFLEVALAAQADALVTGNLKHFPASHTKGVLVLSPAEFAARFPA